MPATGSGTVWIPKAQAQKFDTGAPVLLMFQKLHTIDMTFDLAIAPRKRESGTYRRSISEQALGEAMEFPQATSLKPPKPAVEFLGTATVHDYLEK